MELFQINIPGIMVTSIKAVILASFLILFLISLLHARQTENMGNRLGITIPKLVVRLTSLHMFFAIMFLLLFSALFLLT